MSNTLIIDSLNTLFSMSNTAVLGAQEQFVAFMNPAAQELFRGDRTNHKLSELLPAHITEATATEFVTSATIEKRHVIISVTSFGAFRLFSLVPQDGKRPAGRRAVCAVSGVSQRFSRAHDVFLGLRHAAQ